MAETQSEKSLGARFLTLLVATNLIITIIIIIKIIIIMISMMMMIIRCEVLGTLCRDQRLANPGEPRDTPRMTSIAAWSPHLK